jgi:hypothetical protein
MRMTPQEIVGVIDESGERGRGGAAFPTAVMWRACAETAADEKYLVANGDEGGPGRTSLADGRDDVLHQLARMAAGQLPVLLAGCLSRPTSMERDERTGDVFISEIVSGRVVVVR